MSDKSLQLRNVGPIGDADIQFGDLTVLVGPQATGKSILLQLLKLMLDTGPVFRTLKEKGLNWNGNIGELMQVYVGEGMKGLWDERKSELRWNEAYYSMAK
jgi:predicted ATPase